MMLQRSSPGQSSLLPPEGPPGPVTHSFVFWCPAEICALRSFTFILSSEVNNDR